MSAMSGNRSWCPQLCIWEKVNSVLSSCCCCCLASACLAEQARSPLRAINCLVPYDTEAIPRVRCSRWLRAEGEVIRLLFERKWSRHCLVDSAAISIWEKVKWALSSRYGCYFYLRESEIGTVELIRLLIERKCSLHCRVDTAAIWEKVKSALSSWYGCYLRESEVTVDLPQFNKYFTSKTNKNDYEKSLSPRLQSAQLATKIQAFIRQRNCTDYN